MYESEKKTASRTLSGFLQKKKLGVFTWFHTFSLGFTWFHLVSLGFTWFHLVSLGFTWFHLVSLGFTYFHMVSHIFTWFHMVSHGFTWFHMVSHGFTYFHLVSHIFTLVSHVFTYFHMFSRCEKVWKSVRWITSNKPKKTHTLPPKKKAEQIRCALHLVHHHAEQPTFLIVQNMFARFVPVSVWGWFWWYPCRNRCISHTLSPPTYLLFSGRLSLWLCDLSSIICCSSGHLAQSACRRVVTCIGRTPCCAFTCLTDTLCCCCGCCCLRNSFTRRVNFKGADAQTTKIVRQHMVG